MITKIRNFTKLSIVGLMPVFSSFSHAGTLEEKLLSLDLILCTNFNNIRSGLPYENQNPKPLLFVAARDNFLSVSEIVCDTIESCDRFLVKKSTILLNTHEQTPELPNVYTADVSHITVDFGSVSAKFRDTFKLDPSRPSVIYEENSGQIDFDTDTNKLTVRIKIPEWEVYLPVPCYKSNQSIE